MKGVIFAKQGAEPEIVDDIPKPSPASDQILVKSLWAAINPVDSFMANSGILVVSWPIVLGVDASGIVVDAGAEAQSKYGFKVGDYVCGCTRLGSWGYSSCQEYFLMDAAVTIPKPKNIDVKEAATVGVGIETAGIGLFTGLHIDLPDPKSLPSPKDEWVVIFGGASSVGKFAVQLAIAAGYKVVASCSAKSAAMVQSLGAKTFDYNDSVEKQVKDVQALTGKDVNRAFDAVAEEVPPVCLELFNQSTAPKKYFATTNDWNAPAGFGGGTSYRIELGPIGQEEGAELNANFEKYIPVFVGLMESGAVRPADYHVVGKGFEAAVEAYRYQQTGKAGSKKVLVQIAEE